MRAEPHLRIIDGEMRDAAAELEKLLARIAIALVLLDGVLDRLLGQAVLELERRHRETVDEQRQVERKRGFVPAVAKLAGDREPVQGEALGSLRIAGRRRAVEQVDIVRAVLDATAQHVDNAVL